MVCNKKRKPVFIKWKWNHVVFSRMTILSFHPVCPPAFFRCLSNSGTFTELRTTSFIESTGVACSDSISHNRVQALSISVLLLLDCSQDWNCNLKMIVSLEAQGTNTYNPYAKDIVWSSMKVPEFAKHLKKAGGHIGQKVVEITIKMKTIVRKPLMIKIIKLYLRNLDSWINII